MVTITEEVALSIQGVEYTTNSFFNPIQDEEGNWLISLEEINFCTNLELKELLTTFIN